MSPFDPSPGNSSTARPPADPGPLETGPASPNLIWRVLLDGRDELLINMSTNQLLFSSELGPPDLDLEGGGPLDLNDTLAFTVGHKRNDSGDGTSLNRTVPGRTSSRANRTR